jgi:guanylate kinase
VNGRLVILSGPSGVGKDQALCAWRGVNPLVRRVVSYTTRAPAPTEADGADYHFVTEVRFTKMIAQGAFLEHKLVHGHRYGTPLANMERLLSEGRIAVLKIDVQGALEAMALRPEAIRVFLLPPSWEELERRIRSRGRDDEPQVALRLQTARWEMAQAHHYEHHVVNETGRLIDTALALDRIVAAGGGAPEQ